MTEVTQSLNMKMTDSVTDPQTEVGGRSKRKMDCLYSVQSCKLCTKCATFTSYSGCRCSLSFFLVYK